MGDSDSPSAARWGPQREAADRNERAILAAARRLFADGAVERIEMRDIADEAGVGVGTLYRRFGDKPGLLAAVIGDEELELQQAVLHGEPPLGPGGRADRRLDAFLAALAALTERNLNILLATDSTPPGWLGTGAYEGWRLHVQNLLAELRPDLNPVDRGWHADALLAPLSPQLYARQRRERRLSAQRLARNLRSLATRRHPPPSADQRT
jgi:AcrR family transcriptional regulator